MKPARSALVLRVVAMGRGFLTSDLACYVVGSGLGWGIEAGLRWHI